MHFIQYWHDCCCVNRCFCYIPCAAAAASAVFCQHSNSILFLHWFCRSIASACAGRRKLQPTNSEIIKLIINSGYVYVWRTAIYTVSVSFSIFIVRNKVLVYLLLRQCDDDDDVCSKFISMAHEHSSFNVCAIFGRLPLWFLQ